MIVGGKLTNNNGFITAQWGADRLLSWSSSWKCKPEESFRWHRAIQQVTQLAQMKGMFALSEMRPTHIGHVLFSHFLNRSVNKTNAKKPSKRQTNKQSHCSWRTYTKSTNYLSSLLVLFIDSPSLTSSFFLASANDKERLHTPRKLITRLAIVIQRPEYQTHKWSAIGTREAIFLPGSRLPTKLQRHLIEPIL